MSAAEPFFATRLPRLVMFDLDGTLVDSVPDLTAAVDSMLASLGRPPAGIEKVRQWIGNGARVLVRRALAGSIEHDGIGEEETEAALALFMEAYADSHALTEVYPGVVDTLSCAALTYGYNHGRPIAEEAPTLVIDNLRDLLPCADQAAEIVLPDDSLSPSDQRDQAVAVSKLWMKVIKALARWRWRA
ncbi:hypothetical protein A5N81_00035 [Pseudomonas aeruginosa]|nr:hypothetical protein A5N81_00035 [Pseudomonas aeruginosa]